MSRLMRVFAASLLAFGGVVVGAGRALADGGGPVDCLPGVPGCVVKAGDPGSGGQPIPDPSPPVAAGCTPPTVAWIPADVDCAGCSWTQIMLTPTEALLYPPGETAYEVLCYSVADPNGPTTTTMVYLPPGGTPPVPGVPSATLAARAVARLPFPTMTSASAPGAEGHAFAMTFVNFPTFFWVDGTQWHVLSATANDGFKAVTATATPSYVTWGMGDGHQIACTGPGTAWHPGIESSYCSYTYATSSVHQPQVGTDVNDRPYPVTATVTYQVSWVCAGQCGAQTAGTVGAVNGPTTRTPLVVGEIQTVVTG